MHSCLLPIAMTVLWQVGGEYKFRLTVVEELFLATYPHVLERYDAVMVNGSDKVLALMVNGLDEVLALNVQRP